MFVLMLEAAALICVINELSLIGIAMMVEDSGESSPSYDDKDATQKLSSQAITVTWKELLECKKAITEYIQVMTIINATNRQGIFVFPNDKCKILFPHLNETTTDRMIDVVTNVTIIAEETDLSEDNDLIGFRLNKIPKDRRILGITKAELAIFIKPRNRTEDQMIETQGEEEMKSGKDEVEFVSDENEKKSKLRRDGGAKMRRKDEGQPKSRRGREGITAMKGEGASKSRRHEGSASVGSSKARSKKLSKQKKGPGHEEKHMVRIYGYFNDSFTHLGSLDIKTRRAKWHTCLISAKYIEKHLLMQHEKLIMKVACEDCEQKMEVITSMYQVRQSRARNNTLGGKTKRHRWTGVKEEEDDDDNGRYLYNRSEHVKNHKLKIIGSKRDNQNETNNQRAKPKKMHRDRRPVLFLEMKETL